METPLPIAISSSFLFRSTISFDRKPVDRLVGDSSRNYTTLPKTHPFEFGKEQPVREVVKGCLKVGVYDINLSPGSNVRVQIEHQRHTLYARNQLTESLK